MKKLLIIILLAMAGAIGVSAQEATVKSFETAPMDVTAQQYARLDLHGEKCAVVKVRVIADGVAFKGNLIGEPVENPGEYWVYLTGGTKQVQILARSFLPFMYYFPEPLQGGVTYVLTLLAPQAAGGSAPQGPVANFLVLKVAPASAHVTVDGKERMVNNGVATVKLDAGTHTYRVASLGYAPQEGTVVMDGKKLTRSVTLVSTMPTLTVTTATPGTEIFVNDERKGTDRWSGQLLPDNYTVEGRLAGHRTFSRSLTLAESHSQTVAIPALTAITGTLSVDYTPVDATITIDGRAAGTTPNVITDLPVGTHSVTISAPGYTPATLTATVAESSPATLTGSLSPLPTDPYADDIALTKEYEWFSSTGKCGYKHNGRVVIPAKFDYACPFSEGLALVEINGKYGYIDKTGTVVIPAKFDYAWPFSEGLAMVDINDKDGYIDKTGTMVIPAKFDVAWSFSEGLATVNINDKYGYIDKTGTMVIPAKFDYAVCFSEGLAWVNINGKYGFIDKTGTVVIPAKFDDTFGFYEGKAHVELNGRWFYIDRNGNEVPE